MSFPLAKNPYIVWIEVFQNFNIALKNDIDIQIGYGLVFVMKIHTFHLKNTRSLLSILFQLFDEMFYTVLPAVSNRLFGSRRQMSANGNIAIVTSTINETLEHFQKTIIKDSVYSH
ncbi:MAG: hypothetical protein ACXAC5_11655 [Promethearchaeota archaeon]